MSETTHELTLQTEYEEQSNANAGSSSTPGRSSNQPASPTVKICGYYAQGRCRFGATCKFYHDPNITPALPSPVSQRNNNYQQQRQSPRQGQGMPMMNNGGYFMGGGGGPRQMQYQNLPPQSPQQYFPPPSPQHYLGGNAAGPMPISMNAAIPQPNGGGAPNMNGAPAPSAFPVPFSVPTMQPPPQMQPPLTPPPMIVSFPPNTPVYCIDVECVATGIQHNARSVAQVAMVDQWSRVIFNAYIKQEVPVVSYLTELHGLTKEILEEKGVPLADALAELRSHLSPNAILIGQSIHKDINWLQLVPGIDFHSFINLSDLFKVWNPTHNAYTNFSLDHCAKTWLGIDRKSHEALEDAIISMSLFNSYRHVQFFPMQLGELQHRTITATPRIPGFSTTHPVIEGCCMGNRKKCICGAPFE